MKKNFTSETLKKMKYELDNTTEKERGFVLCKRHDGLITYGKSHIGNIGEVKNGAFFQKVRVRNKCDKNEDFIGDYHTHTNKSDASIADLTSAFVYDVLRCVGSKPDNINCFRRKAETRDMSEEENVEHEYKEVLSKIRKINTMYKSNKISKEDANKLKHKLINAATSKLRAKFNIFKL